MLDSYLLVARKQAELLGVLQLTYRQETTEQPKLIPYKPQIPMTKGRSQPFSMQSPIQPSQSALDHCHPRVNY
jgi:hypothetical protein